MTIRRTIFLILIAILFSFGAVPTIDPDLWWHLKTGELIVTHGIPHTDIFSFSMTGAPWMAHEWLPEVFMWFVQKHGGLPALLIAFALMSVLIFSMVYFTCAGRPFLAFPLTVLSCWTSHFIWGARPQIFNILMLATFIWLMENIRSKRLRWQWIYAFPPLIILWANMHTGYFTGIAVLFVYLIGDAIQIIILKREEGTLGKALLPHLAVMPSLAWIAALVNPNGCKIWGFPLEALSSKTMQDLILEWYSPDFHHWFYKPFSIVMVLGAAVFMTTCRRRTVAEVLLYGGSMAAGLMSRRHIPLFAVVAIPIISRSALDCFQDLKWRDLFEGKSIPHNNGWLLQLVNTCLVIAMFAGAAMWTRGVIAGNDLEIKKKFPVTVVKLIQKTGLGHFHGYNDYGWGGYLIWSGIPVFIDGRSDVYGDRFLMNYFDTINVRKNWKNILDSFKYFEIRFVLMHPSTPLSIILRLNKNWKEVYRDDVASLFMLLPQETSSPRQKIYSLRGKQPAVPV